MSKLEFEGDVAERLDAHYGSKAWRSLVVEHDHILRIGGVNRDGTQVEETPSGYIDAFGSRWRTDMRVPHLEEPALSEPSLQGYRFPEAAEFLKPNWREDLLERIGQNDGKFVLIGLGFGMFVRTWIIRGWVNALTDAVAEPAFYAELLDRLCDLDLALLDELLTLPVDGVILDGDWGNQRGIMLGPERWRCIIKPRLARLYERIHRANKYTFHHSCGNVRDVIPDLIEIGLDVLQSVQPEAMDPYELKREFGKDLTFWGGLGSQRIIPFGTPDEIRQEVDRLCRVMGEGGGYILGPAKALQPETPTANAAAVVESFLEQVGASVNEAVPNGVA
jgi:uroporphyrinogen decarboxylase